MIRKFDFKCADGCCTDTISTDTEPQAGLIHLKLSDNGGDNKDFFLWKDPKGLRALANHLLEIAAEADGTPNPNVPQYNVKRVLNGGYTVEDNDGLIVAAFTDPYSLGAHIGQNIAADPSLPTILRLH